MVPIYYDANFVVGGDDEDRNSCCNVRAAKRRDTLPAMRPPNARAFGLISTCIHTRRNVTKKREDEQNILNITNITF
jgi:hypothetical protein